MTFSVPVFVDGRLLAFAGCMAHWPDIGGTLDGITTDIFSEGLQLPIVKAYREGVQNEDIVEIIKMNVRLPERAMGDLRAQIAAVKTGEEALCRDGRQYGADAVLAAAIDGIMDQSEAASRAPASPRSRTASTRLESFMDDDGVTAGKSIPIRVKVTIAGDRMTVDFTDLSRQVSGLLQFGRDGGAVDNARSRSNA